MRVEELRAEVGGLALWGVINWVESDLEEVLRVDVYISAVFCSRKTLYCSQSGLFIYTTTPHVHSKHF